MRDRPHNLRVLTAFLVLASSAFAQSTPPPCQGLKPSTTSRPTAQQITATAEAGASDPSVLVANEPLENFGALRYRIEDYADCTGGGGCYWADVDAQLVRAETALKAALGSRKASDKLALVLDIDETSLSSYCEEQREDYGYIKPLYDKWTVSPEASVPLPGTVRLYNFARTSGVAVFFITGRPDEQRSATAANLKAAGYEGWAGLRLREGAQKTMTTMAYKSAERQKIVDAGYKLLMNVGDQWSDLNGSPRAVINVKLPNPFYYLP